jgi:hypothetical protein
VSSEDFHCTITYREVEFVTALSIKITVFWDGTRCSLVVSSDVSEEPAASVWRVNESFFSPKTKASDSSETLVTCLLTYTASHPTRY